MIDLRPDHLAIVQAILGAEIPDAEVRCFGSRARWTSSESSDLDLVIRAASPLSLSVLHRLRSLFEESFLPFSVDIVDWHRIDDDFRNAIRDETVVVATPHKESPGGPIEPRWKAVPLSDCANFLSGGTPSKGSHELWLGSTPWVSAGDMKQLWLSDTMEHVAPDALSNGTRTVPPGTVLLLVRGTLHKDLPIVLTQAEMAFHQDVKALIPRNDIDPLFLAYSLIGNKPALLTFVDTATDGIGRINSTALESFPIAVPPLNEQRRIAAFLGALDDKIELNRTMNQTLTKIEREIQAHSNEDLSWIQARKGSNSRQSQTLTKIRDILIPKLTSGELRVPASTEN